MLLKREKKKKLRHLFQTIYIYLLIDIWPISTFLDQEVTYILNLNRQNGKKIGIKQKQIKKMTLAHAVFRKQPYLRNRLQRERIAS